MEISEYARNTHVVNMSETSPAKTIPLSVKDKVCLGRRILRSPNISPKSAVQALLVLLLHGSKYLYDAEKMDMYEKIVTDSLGSGQHEVAKEYLLLLERRFGSKSNRIRLLKGMLLEAEGNDAEAEKQYVEILRSNPSHLGAVQRQAAMRAGKGKIRDAIRILEYDLVYSDESKEKFTFREIHPKDQKTLLQLSKWYYELNECDRAIHCIEDCVLSDPDNYVYHARAGELEFQQKQWKNSIAYFSHSLLLNDSVNNCRAAFGLHQATKNALLAVKQHGNKMTGVLEVEAVQKLHQKVRMQIKKMYAKSSLLTIVELYLERTSM